MAVDISVKIDNQRLVINAFGVIADHKGHERLTTQLFHEIKKHGIDRIMIDVSNIEFPTSLEFHNNIVDFYVKEMPAEMKRWKIAVVDESNYRVFGYYWEFLANEQGFLNFKVFASVKDADEYLA